jgi:hypothetical protein
MRHLRRRTLPHWIALLAIWSAALLPTLTHLVASASGDGASRVAVCTPQGLRWVVVGADGAAQAPADPGTPAGHAGQSDHCPLCRVQADAPPMPVSDAALVAVQPLSDAAPPLFLHAPRPLHAWRAAHPRGPPVLS